MEDTTNNLLRRFSVQQLIGITVSVGILLLALASTIVISRQSGETVRERLTDEGLRLADSLAGQSRLSIVTADEDGARATAAHFLAFPDVVAVELRDLQGWRIQAGRSDQSETGQRPVQKPLSPDPTSSELISEDETTWEFATPVFFGSEAADPFGSTSSANPELIGYAHLLMDKGTLSLFQSLNEPEIQG